MQVLLQEGFGSFLGQSERVHAGFGPVSLQETATALFVGGRWFSSVVLLMIFFEVMFVEHQCLVNLVLGQSERSHALLVVALQGALASMDAKKAWSASDG
jgi:hypothetical protein